MFVSYLDIAHFYCSVSTELFQVGHESRSTTCAGKVLQLRSSSTCVIVRLFDCSVRDEAVGEGREQNMQQRNGVSQHEFTACRGHCSTRPHGVQASA
jgi:hypothetical protein